MGRISQFVEEDFLSCECGGEKKAVVSANEY